MKRGLPKYWVRWRRRRYQALASQGLCGDLAWRLAKGEAAGRHRVAKVIGNEGARGAELELHRDGREISFRLIGRCIGLSNYQLDAIEALNGATPKQA